MTSVLGSVDAALQQHFAQSPARASVSFLGVEPLEVLRFEPIPDEVAYISLGMARRPMTSAQQTVQAADGPRAELMLHLHATAPGSDEVWRRVAVLAAAPDVEGVVYVAGMTVDLGEPLAVGSVCTGFVVTESALQPITTDVGEVAVLQVIPAASTELAWSRVHGTSALRQRWAEHHCDLLDLARRPVPLD